MTENPFVFLALSGRDASRQTLDCLAGGGRILEFTLPYAPPYEAFDGIRELQLAVRRMGAFPPECLALDLTEWVGREEEEYFEITAMYLHDHRDLWRYVFLVREREAGDCAALFFTLRAFLEGEFCEDRTFADRENLAAYLTERFPAAVERSAADRLASILMKPNAQARMLRSYPRVDALMEELARDGKITEAGVLEAVRDPASVLHLIEGREIETEPRREWKPARVERSEYGKEAV